MTRDEQQRLAAAERRAERIRVSIARHEYAEMTPARRAIADLRRANAMTRELHSL
jgi:hypothetical protein